jgi:hypothetical protein
MALRTARARRKSLIIQSFCCTAGCRKDDIGLAARDNVALAPGLSGGAARTQL